MRPPMNDAGEVALAGDALALTAVVVLILRTPLGQFVGAVTYAYLANLEVAGARAISAVARSAIVVFVIAVSLEQLSIGGQVLVSGFLIAFGALCRALARAFGLGRTRVGVARPGVPFYVGCFKIPRERIDVTDAAVVG